MNSYNEIILIPYSVARLPTKWVKQLPYENVVKVRKELNFHNQFRNRAEFILTYQRVLLHE